MSCIRRSANSLRSDDKRSHSIIYSKHIIMVNRKLIKKRTVVYETTSEVIVCSSKKNLVVYRKLIKKRLFMRHCNNDE